MKLRYLGTIAGLTLSAMYATAPAAASTITYDAVLSGDGKVLQREPALRWSPSMAT